MTNLIHLRIFFKILQFFWPSWYILAFKRLVFCTPILIWSKSSIKRSYGWYKSRIRHIDVCLYKLVFQATRVAFLAFSVLKLKNIQISEQTTSNKPKNSKKCKLLLMVTVWPLIGLCDLCWPFFIFSEILDV